MATDATGRTVLDWLMKHFAAQDHIGLENLKSLAFETEHLVRLYLSERQPLRPAAMAKTLKTLARHLAGASEAAEELGEQGITQMLLASNANNIDAIDPLKVMADLHAWKIWSGTAAETAKNMSVSSRDHKGGRTPDRRLRKLVLILAERYETLLGIAPDHSVSTTTHLGEGSFDMFVKEAIRCHAPIGQSYEPRAIDDATRRALGSGVTMIDEE